MRTKRPVLITALCGLLALIPGCATNSAPRGWLRQSEETQFMAFGGWIDVQHKTATLQKRPQKMKGELIAIHTDSIFILTETGLLVLSKADISRAKVTAFNSNSSTTIGWTFLGTLSTLSHGLFLIFTAPAWILTGTIATIAQSRAPQIAKTKRNTWEALAKYARFPQGITVADRIWLSAAQLPGLTIFKSNNISPDKLQTGVYVQLIYRTYGINRVIVETSGFIVSFDDTRLQFQPVNHKDQIAEEVKVDYKQIMSLKIFR